MSCVIGGRAGIFLGSFLDRKNATRGVMYMNPVAPLLWVGVWVGFLVQQGSGHLQFIVGTADQADGIFPGNAFVCNGDSIFQVGETVAALLVAFKEVAFQHQAYDAIVAVQSLVYGAFEYKGLTLEFLARVVMGTIDHHRLEYFLFLQSCLGLAHGDRVVIRGGSPPEYQVTIGVALGADNRGMSIGVNAQKMLGGTSRLNGIYGC